MRLGINWLQSTDDLFVLIFLVGGGGMVIRITAYLIKLCSFKFFH